MNEVGVDTLERVEAVEAIEASSASLEFTCEAKLGYGALCASCPLVAMLGDCPKVIREQHEASEDVLVINEAPDEAIQGDPFSLVIEASQVEEFPHNVPVPEEVAPRDDRRTYREQLLDDSVPVVVAESLRPKVEKASSFEVVREVEFVSAPESVVVEPLVEVSDLPQVDAIVVRDDEPVVLEHEAEIMVPQVDDEPIETALVIEEVAPEDELAEPEDEPETVDEGADDVVPIVEPEPTAEDADELVVSPVQEELPALNEEEPQEDVVSFEVNVAPESWVDLDEPVIQEVPLLIDEVQDAPAESDPIVEDVEELPEETRAEDDIAAPDEFATWTVDTDEVEELFEESTVVLPVTPERVWHTRTLRTPAQRPAMWWLLGVLSVGRVCRVVV